MLFASALAIFVLDLGACRAYDDEYSEGYHDSPYSNYVEDQNTFSFGPDGGRVRRYGESITRIVKLGDAANSDVKGALEQILPGRQIDFEQHQISPKKRLDSETTLITTILHQYDEDMSATADASEPSVITEEMGKEVQAKTITPSDLLESSVTRGPQRSTIHIPPRSTIRIPTRPKTKKASSLISHTQIEAEMSLTHADQKSSLERPAQESVTLQTLTALWSTVDDVTQRSTLSGQQDEYELSQVYQNGSQLQNEELYETSVKVVARMGSKVQDETESDRAMIETEDDVSPNTPSLKKKKTTKRFYLRKRSKKTKPTTTTIPPMPLYWQTYKPPTTTPTPTTPQFNIDAFLEIIANLTYDYETNLTMQVNETLLKYSVPTCPGPNVTFETTTVQIATNKSIVAKCFVCGLKSTGIPYDSDCADAFAGDFLPLLPVNPLARAKSTRYRKYCRYGDVHNYHTNVSQPRTVYGRWTGGCAVRWTDVSGLYTQRTCRNRHRAIVGRHYGSKRMAKLEMMLTSMESGCVVSPVATLLPLSRGVSLFARFHACVCMGNWCNWAVRETPSLLAAVLYAAAALLLADQN